MTITFSYNKNTLLADKEFVDCMVNEKLAEQVGDFEAAQAARDRGVTILMRHLTITETFAHDAPKVITD